MTCPPISRDGAHPERAPGSGDAALRVALYSGNYNYEMDGPVRALNTLVAHLIERGHQALVFAPTSKKSYLPHAGELISVPSIAAPGRSEYRIALGLFGAQKERLAAFKPDLVHIAAPDLGGRAMQRWAARHGVPVVASFHTRFDTYPRYYGLGFLEPRVTAYLRRFYARCVHVYPPSPSMLEELKRDRIGRDLRLWTRGVDSALFHPARRDMAWRRAQGFADDDVVAVFVGRIVLEKGIDAFADAVKRGRQNAPKLRALIVGDGPELSRFREALPDGVFTGRLLEEDLARAYASADIFFNPSITETFGNVTLEAMASGLPSVGADAAGSATLIDAGKTGLRAPPEPARFAEALVALAGDASRRAAMGAAAREAAQAYSWPAVLDRLIADYRDAIASYHGAAGSGRRASGSPARMAEAA